MQLYNLNLYVDNSSWQGHLDCKECDNVNLLEGAIAIKYGKTKPNRGYVQHLRWANNENASFSQMKILPTVNYIFLS